MENGINLSPTDQEVVTEARELAGARPASRKLEDVAYHLGRTGAALERLVRLVDRVVASEPAAHTPAVQS